MFKYCNLLFLLLRGLLYAYFYFYIAKYSRLLLNLFVFEGIILLFAGLDIRYSCMNA